jgi:hypothetical protein
MQLIHAAEQGNPKEVANLLRNNPDCINQTNEENQTALFIAAERGYADIVAKLLDQPNIDVNKTDLLGYSPLHIASSEGHADIVDLLIHAKAKTNQVTTDFDEENALHCAAKAGYTAIVHALLEADATHIDKKNKAGNMPLDLAVRNGDTNNVETLLKKGAPIHNGIFYSAVTAGKVNLLPILAAYVLRSKGIHAELCSILSTFPMPRKIQATLRWMMDYEPLEAFSDEEQRMIGKELAAISKNIWPLLSKKPSGPLSILGGEPGPTSIIKAFLKNPTTEPFYHMFREERRKIEAVLKIQQGAKRLLEHQRPEEKRKITTKKETIKQNFHDKKYGLTRYAPPETQPGRAEYRPHPQ